MRGPAEGLIRKGTEMKRFLSALCFLFLTNVGVAYAQVAYVPPGTPGVSYWPGIVNAPTFYQPNETYFTPLNLR